MKIHPNERVMKKVDNIKPYKNNIRNFMYKLEEKMSLEQILREHLPELNFKVVELDKNKKVLIDFRDEKRPYVRPPQMFE